MLGDFEHQAVVAVLGFERIQNRRQVALELHVDDGADHLGDASDLIGCGSHDVSLQHISQSTVSVTGTLPRVARE